MITIKQMCSVSDGPDWIYANGHGLDRATFLAEAQEFIAREYGVFGPRDEPIAESDVLEKWFKRMSPSEAREQGVDWGVWEQDEPGSGAYPVTRVEV